MTGKALNRPIRRGDFVHLGVAPKRDGLNACCRRSVVAVEDPDLDVLEFIKDGSAPDLVPVPGKITVFDFWAPWCKPCKQLSGDLRELSMRHPDKIAVRMVNVVDWDSPAAARWLTPG